MQGIGGCLGSIGPHRGDALQGTSTTDLLQTDEKNRGGSRILCARHAQRFRTVVSPSPVTGMLCAPDAKPCSEFGIPASQELVGLGLAHPAAGSLACSAIGVGGLEGCAGHYRAAAAHRMPEVWGVKLEGELPAMVFGQGRDPWKSFAVTT